MGKKKDPLVAVLRELFRNLTAFRSLHEAEGIDTVIAPDGTAWTLWDVIALYEESQRLLPPQQRRAIELCLVENMREEDAALAMGVSKDNPVASYATLGLEKLVNYARAGMLPRFRVEPQEAVG